MNPVHKTNNMISTVLRRIVLFALFWWLLNTTDTASWIIGVPAIVIALLVSLKLSPPRPWRWRLLPVIRFLPVFIWESIRGGIDVSLRVLRPAMPLHPAIVEYEITLPKGLPQLLMLNVVSLLPGTLSADLRGHRLILHVLDRNTPFESDLQRTEKHIAGIFDTNAGSTKS
jgi:multicomponent Na+:H+ antiporter subunit E